MFFNPTTKLLSNPTNNFSFSPLPPIEFILSSISINAIVAELERENGLLSKILSEIPQVIN